MEAEKLFGRLERIAGSASGAKINFHADWQLATRLRD
jgi:hypothetical protein